MTAGRRLTVVLGINQLLVWATTFYAPAVIAGPAAESLGLSRAATLGAVSWALLLSSVCAPRIGRHIDRVGGRGVLAAGAVTTACGMALLAAAHGIVSWYAGWSVLGVGMALALYEAAFSTAGRLHGEAARPIITGITLFGGFASSVGWSAGTALVGAFGWRATLVLYAALLLAVNLPLVLVLVPAAVSPAARPASAAPTGAAGPAGTGQGRRFVLTCLIGFFSLRWLLTSALGVFILGLLQGVGLTAAGAVMVAALIGPGQVVGRIVELTIGDRIGLITRARLAAAVLPLGVAALLFGGPAAAPVFAVLYGMSNGILTINRGTLPLTLFGAEGYAALLGWLAVPVLLAQAAAPTLAAPLIGVLAPQTVFLLAGVIGALAMLFLLPLRSPPRAPV